MDTSSYDSCPKQHDSNFRTVRAVTCDRRARVQPKDSTGSPSYHEIASILSCLNSDTICYPVYFYACSHSRLENRLVFGDAACTIPAHRLQNNAPKAALAFLVSHYLLQTKSCIKAT